jgi:hypothetical protein
MTEEGFLKAKELFERYFAKEEEKTIPLPKFTTSAKNDGNRYLRGREKKSSKQYGAPSAGLACPCYSVREK